MTLEQEYEYKYQNNSLTNAHSFLTKPLLSILSEKSQPGAKILDLGCGNGSLSNVISECGYEVFGMEESPSGVTIASQNFPNCQFIQGSIYNSPPPRFRKCL